MKRSVRTLDYFSDPLLNNIRQLLLIAVLVICGGAVGAQTSYTWNGSVSTAWNTAANWTPSGVPGAADNVTIVTGSNTCKLSAASTISNFKISSGTLDLGGFTFTIGGTTATFSAGTVQNGTVSVTGATSTAFGNGPVTMNCAVNITSAAITLRGTTFQQAVTLTKNGSSNDYSTGGNIFNGALTMNNAGTGYFVFANSSPDQYNAASTFNNTGGANLYLGNGAAGITYGATATFNNNNSTSGAIIIGQNSTSTFNANIVVTSVGGSGVQFGGGASATTLSAGNTITIGAAGFSGGTLLLRQFTQTGSATPENFALTGSGNLTFGPSSSFDASVTASSPTFYLNGCVFNGTTNMTKTGSSGDWSSGGNTFNDVCSIINIGTSYFLLGSTNPDTWNSDVTFTDNSTERVLPCWSSAGNQFNGNIYVNCIGSSQGIQFCGGSGSATATLAAGKTIQAGSLGLTAGYLQLKQFTQLGTSAITLNGTGSSVMYLGPNSNFGGVFTATAPDIWAQGATYNSAATFNKTGGSNNHNNQYQNIFNSTCTINQQSSTGYFMVGYNSNDQFNDNITVTCTGAGGIYLGWSNGVGTPTLAAGKTIQVGSAGFNAGFLAFNNFTQLGNAAINLSFTGAATSLLFANRSTFGGDMTLTVPDIRFNGAIFGGAMNMTKTGAGNDYSNGGNTFQGVTTINDPATGYIVLGNGQADTCNSDITFNSTGSGFIDPAWNSANNMYNGNINVSSTNSSTGIYFCSNAAASATLAAGKTIQINSGGFSTGTLSLRQFTQLGNTPINLTLTGPTTLLQSGPGSAFGGSFTVVSPRILMNGAVYSDVVSLTKNGVTGEWSFGGNTFNSTVTVNQQGGGYFGFANGAPDIYNGDLYVNNNSTERVIFGNNPTGNQFNGNIILTQVGSSVGTAFGWSATTNETMAAGKTISIGSAGFSTGYLQLMRFTQLGSTAVNLPLTGTASLTFGPTSAFGGDLTSTSASLFFNGCTFNGAANCTKNGATSDGSNGGNIFNGVATITNAGSNSISLANGSPDQFNAAATFNNTGSGNIYVANNSSNNVFAGVTTFTNSPTAANTIYVGNNSTGTNFNGNIIVNSTNGNGVQFCAGNATATATLAAGQTISVGSAGFSSGTLLLRQFTQTGSTPQSLALTGTSDLVFGPSSEFDGNTTGSSPALQLQGCLFNGTTNLTKTGASGDYSSGGNTFNGVCSITNSGTSYVVLGNANPDIWNSDVTFTDNGSERLLPCWATAGNQFNGNIFVNTAGSAQGIQFCGGNSTATATQAAGGTVQAGSLGLTAGYLQLKQFTQLGSAPVNLTLTSTATYLQFGPLSAIGGNVVTSSPGLYFQGCNFSGTTNCTKTGSSNDGSSGNNIFNGVSNMTNAGSGYLLFANGNRDQFNANATFNNTGSSNIYVAYNSPNNVFGGVTTFNNSPTGNTGIYVSNYSVNTVFNGNIVVGSTNGQGVQFCTGNTSATAILSPGLTISVGSGGFSAGVLWLRQFTQSGSTPQSLTLTGTGNLTFGPLSNIGGNITTTSPTLLFNGCTFGGTVVSVKNGSTSDASNGNNTFNGPFTVTNTGSGYFLMGNGSPDLWQSTATFNNQSTAAHMYTAYNSSGNIFNGDVTINNQPGATSLWFYANSYGIGTQFNGNIILNNTNGAGIYFGTNTGTATLSSGKAVSIGSAGFNYGQLIFRSFTQSGGGTAQNLTTTGTSAILYGPYASFDGPVTSQSPDVFFNGTTFNGTVNCSKTGSGGDYSNGNNIFNGVSTFTNNGTGILYMTNNTADAYNNDVYFIQNSTGALYPNYNNNSTYAGHVNVTSPSATAMVFGNGNGTATFTGSAAQNINATAGTPIPTFTRLVIANSSSSGVTLKTTSVNVSKTLAMTSGLLNTSTTYILTMLNGSTTSSGTALSTSYVNGPMRYQKSSSGSSTLNFPIGTAPDCRPFVLTVNHSSGSLFTYTAQLYNADAGLLNYALPPTVNRVSAVHYWIITRTDASGTVQPNLQLSGSQTIQLYFGSDDVVSDGSSLTVCKNTYLSPTQWIDIGGAGGPAYSGGASLSGSITSTSSPTIFNSFSTFTLGNRTGGINVLPVGLIDFRATPDNGGVDLGWTTTTESNNSYFTIEKSQDGVNFSFVEKVGTQALNGTSSVPLYYTGYDANPYTGISYYRLKQTDIDGHSVYSGIVSVNFTKKAVLSVYPNPSKGTVYVSGLGINETLLRAEWYDMGGRLLQQEAAAVTGGTAILNPRFNNGAYLLKLISSDGSIQIKNIIILK